METPQRFVIFMDTVGVIELNGDFSAEEIENYKKEYPFYTVTHLPSPRFIIQSNPEMSNVTP